MTRLVFRKVRKASEGADPLDDDVTSGDDPARIATAVLFERACATAGTSLEEVGGDGKVVVVIMPSAEWAEAASAEWSSSARNGDDSEEGLRERFWKRDAWVSWAPGEAPRLLDVKQASQAFHKAVSQGRHCAGFASDPTWLPPDLVQGADHRLILPTLTSRDVGIVAAELCGHDSTEVLTEAQAAALTPRLLRLARRPRQSTDAYLRKLRDLVGRELAPRRPTPTDSPRDAPTLDRLHGMEEAVAWGRDVARDLEDFLAGRIAWADVDKGCLFSGPPGCGKTLFARALAATCGVPLITGSYGEWQAAGHQGDLLKAMRKTFAEARAKAPCILFIDEVDSFPNRATLTHDHADYVIQVVNALLAEIDGVEGRPGVVLVAACNHPAMLDPALIRSGRLDRHIRVGLPDRAALAAILREQLGTELAGEDLSGAALWAAGSSGADCERLVRGARRRARSAGRTMALQDLLDEIGGHDVRSQEDLWRAAVHEAGHVLAVCILRPGTLDEVNLRASGGSGGAMRASRSRSYLLPEDIRAHLVDLLAGRAAEEVILGKPSSGAGGDTTSDLAGATKLAATAAAALGLAGHPETLLWRGLPTQATLPTMLTDNPVLADRVHVLLCEAYREATEMVRSHRHIVEAVATALVERRALDGGEAADLVARHLAGEAKGFAP